jgi:uncharacterized protein with PIN domain
MTITYDEDPGMIVRRGRRGEFAWSERAGFSGRKVCPDCKTPLVRIMKEDARESTASVCPNHLACFRGTNPRKLETWKVAV